VRCVTPATVSLTLCPCHCVPIISSATQPRSLRQGYVAQAGAGWHGVGVCHEVLGVSSSSLPPANGSVHVWAHRSSSRHVLRCACGALQVLESVVKESIDAIMEPGFGNELNKLDSEWGSGVVVLTLEPHLRLQCAPALLRSSRRVCLPLPLPSPLCLCRAAREAGPVNRPRMPACTDTV
jgi:hypothetical protein